LTASGGRRFGQVYKNRLATFLVLFLISFIVLVSRLACMQVAHGHYYEDIVERKRSRVEIYAGPRGAIYDRRGRVLARDMEVHDASFILPLLDPLVVVRPLVCGECGISPEQFDRHLGRAMEAARTGPAEQTLLQSITPRAARRLRYLSGEYPEKYGALVVRETEAGGETRFLLAADIEQLCRRHRTLEKAAGLLDIPLEDAAAEVDETEKEISGIANSYQRNYELYTPYPLARNITREQVEELEVRYRDYPGLIVTVRSQRVYPEGDLACHVLGYLRQLSPEEYKTLREQGRTIRRGFNELEDFDKIATNPFFMDDMVGATGVERVYDKVLQGKKGARLLVRDIRTPDCEVLSEVPPQPGFDLHLTLDAQVQRAAQDALAEAGLVGAVVVMDVGSGELIALASSPCFDPGTFRKDQETYQKHMEKPYPLLNRALCALAPGSGYKLVTAIAGLEENEITPNTHMYCRGYFKKPGEFRCWNRNGHGSISLSKAIEASCNVYFCGVGQRVGQEKLRKWALILGFGARTGIDLPGDSAGLIPSPAWKEGRVPPERRRVQRLQMEYDSLADEIAHREQIEKEQPLEDGTGLRQLEALREREKELKATLAREKEKMQLFETERAWVPGDTWNMAIGQGYVLVTPLQMARLTAAIANGGTLYRPHLAAAPGVDYAAGTLPVSARTLDAVREGMRAVVFGAQGTARSKELQKHKAAAKTGTAELGGEWNNGWIAGFAPYDRPRIAFAVVAERVKEHGGEAAGPIAARVLDAYFGEPGRR
jgi:penicillin-binding protein 2